MSSSHIQTVSTCLYGSFDHLEHGELRQSRAGGLDAGRDEISYPFELFVVVRLYWKGRVVRVGVGICAKVGDQVPETSEIVEVIVIVVVTARVIV